MEGSFTTGENGQISISLISQFCDARLKEMSTKCSAEELQKSSIYSDVLLPNTDENEMEIDSSGESIDRCNVRGFDDNNPSFANLSIERNVTFSKHIKPVSITEWMNLEKKNPCVGVVSPGKSDPKLNEVDEILNLSDISGESNIDNDDLTAMVKDRLECYLPILGERVKYSKWAKLKSVISLGVLTSGAYANEFNLDSETSNNCRWDAEQAIPITSTKELMVFYGMIEKPTAIKHKRLMKLFSGIGVASLPLQSMMTNRKQLYLNDTKGLIHLNDLSGKIKYGEIVGGVVVAIIGRVIGTSLLAEDVLFPTPCAPEWPLPSTKNIEMVFVSGLNLGNEGGNLALDLLQDYLLGLSGSEYEQSEILASRARIFLVGNSIKKSMRTTSNNADKERFAEKYTKAMGKLDEFLEPLLRTMEIFIIPGENDLTLTSSLPQPPLHPRMLPMSGAYPSLKRLTNPARVQVSITQASENEKVNESNEPGSSLQECSMMESSFAEFLKEDVHFIDMLFQSGGNIKETMDHCDISSPLQTATRLLKWGHLHPTFNDSNFSLAQNLFRLKGALPHVAVIGNLSEFKCINWRDTQIICLPTFSNSQTAVVLTKDFSVVPIRFKLM